MNAAQLPITLDVANRTIANVSIAQATAKLSKYARMDGGELRIALGDHHGFYLTEENRPPYACEVWVMAGDQPISAHGPESDLSFASACTTLLGLRIARHFAAAQEQQANTVPWLDSLSLVTLYAMHAKGENMAPVPLLPAIYDQALKNGVDMALFTCAVNADEHF